MRIFWSVFLAVGLAVVLLSVIERRGTQADPASGHVHTSEDGTGFPDPYPTPSPKDR